MNLQVITDILVYGLTFLYFYLLQSWWFSEINEQRQNLNYGSG